MKCKFNKALIGRCGNEADDSGYCKEHKDLVCCSCGEKATHECEVLMDKACRAPLCDECEHSIYPNGCETDFMEPKGEKAPDDFKPHRKKTEQIYKLWHEREEDDDIYSNKVVK